MERRIGKHHGRSLQYGTFAAGEDFCPVKTKEAPLRKFCAINEKPLREPAEQHPARGILFGEYGVREKLIPVGMAEGRGLFVRFKGFFELRIRNAEFQGIRVILCAH